MAELSARTRGGLSRLARSATASGGCGLDSPPPGAPSPSSGSTPTLGLAPLIPSRNGRIIPSSLRQVVAGYLRIILKGWSGTTAGKRKSRTCNRREKTKGLSRVRGGRKKNPRPVEVLRTSGRGSDTQGPSMQISGLVAQGIPHVPCKQQRERKPYLVADSGLDPLAFQLIFRPDSELPLARLRRATLLTSPRWVRTSVRIPGRGQCPTVATK